MLLKYKHPLKNDNHTRTVGTWLLSFFSLVLLSQTALAAVITVNTTADNGAGSLRAAISSAASSDIIDFDSGVFSPSSPATITLTSALPSISQGSITIDASNAGVILDGANSVADCLSISSSNNNIQGIRIQNCTVDGIDISSGTGNIIGGNNTSGSGPSGEGNVIVNIGSVDWNYGINIKSDFNNVYGNFIGTNGSATGLGNGSGIQVTGDSNTIGGTGTGQRNIISGNNNYGIYISAANSNTIQGNYIGTDVSGELDLGNGWQGIRIDSGSQLNTIGGTTAAARNIVSGNNQNGILIHGATTASNVISGNYIGTNATGLLPLGNSDDGIEFTSSANSNTIGGSSAAARNIISANGARGVFFWDADNNTVSGNYIGIDANGTAPLGNTSMGVFVGSGSTSNTIGGSVVGTGNVVSSNGSANIRIEGSSTSSNVVQGNLVGLNAAGNAILGSTSYGVYLTSNTTANIIGGTSAAERNIISGHTISGVYLGPNINNNTIQGNYIGTDSAGTANLGNSVGIYITGGQSTIGGTTANSGNVIAWSTGDGIAVATSSGETTSILGNYIGTNASNTAMPNGGDGVDLGTGIINLGDASEVQPNTIGPNTGNGIEMRSTGTINLAGTVDINGSVRQFNGTLNMGSATLNLSGNWNHIGGTVNAATSTLTLDGSSAQSITSGGNAFNNVIVTNATNIVTFADALSTTNLTAVTPSSQLTFGATTHTISGTLNLNGQASGTEVILRSNAPTNRFTLNVTGGAQNVSFVDVQDANASGNDITATNSLNNGNNDDGDAEPTDQWRFILLLSGKAYTDEGTTPLADGVSINLVVQGNSVGSGLTFGGDGSYSITTSLLSGNELFVYIDDDATYKGMTVTVSDGSAPAAFNLYANRVILRHDNGATLTNALMDAALGSYSDSGIQVDDIIYSLDGGNNLIIAGSTTELFVATGHSFTPGAAVTTADMDINGSLDAGANTVNVARHWDASGGVFTSTGTVTFSASSGTANINPGGSDFNNIIFSASGDTDTFTLQGALTANTNVNISEGILNTANFPIEAGNNFVQLATGRVQAGSSTLTVGGNFEVEGTEDSTSYNNATVTLNGGGKNLTYNNLSNPESNGFYNINVGQSTAVDTLTNALAVNGQLSVGSGSFIGGLGIYLTGNGDVLSFDPAANLAIDALRFMGGSPNIASLINGYDSDIYVQGNNTVLTQTGDITLKSGQWLYVHGNDSQVDRTATYDTAEFDLNVGGSIELGAGTDTGLKTLNINNSAVSVAGDFNIQSGPTQAQITTSGSTVTFNGNTNQQLRSSGNIFNNIGLNNNGGAGSNNLIINDDLDIDGALRIDDGDFDISANNPAVNIAGDLIITANGTIDTNGRSNQLVFDGTSILTDTSSTGPQDLENVELNGTSLTLASDTLVSTMTITAGTLDLANGGYVFEVDGTGTPISNLGSFNAGTSTVKYSGTGTATNITTLAYNNLQLSPTAATNYSLLGNLSGANAMTGNLNIDANANLDAASDYNLSANNITIDGTYTAQNSTIQASGNWTNNGSFTANTSTVELVGTNQSISGTNTFNNLYKNVSSADTLTFEADLTQTINGTIRLEGVVGERLTLASSNEGLTRWNLNVTALATKEMDYLSVSWSDASDSAPAQRPIEPSNSIDGGDNLEWFGTPVITVEKSTTVVSDPINGTTEPKRIPGAVVQYDIKVTNSGTGAPDLDSIFITDPIDTSTVEFDFSSGVTLTDGTPASTLILGTVEYSNDSGASYVYSPTGPYDPNITHIKILASGTFDYGATPANNFSLSYQVRVK